MFVELIQSIFCCSQTKAAVAAVANAPRLVPQVEAEVTNMPTGLHTIQVGYK